MRRFRPPAARRFGVNATLRMGGAIALLLGLSPARAAAPLGRAGAVRVAVFDMLKVLKGYARCQRAEAELDRDWEALVRAFRLKRDVLTKLQEEAGRSGLSAARKAEVNRQIRAAERAIERLYGESHSAPPRKLSQKFKLLYADVQEAAARVARKRGYDVVLYHFETAPDPSCPNPFLITRRADDSHMSIRRTIWPGALKPTYSAPGVDITEDLIEELNRAYRLKTAAGAG